MSMAKTSHSNDFAPVRDGEVGWIQVYRKGLELRATATSTPYEYDWFNGRG
jgi:hypothetical protein